MNWRARDKNGEWFAYKYQPTLEFEHWGVIRPNRFNTITSGELPSGFDNVDWKDTAHEVLTHEVTSDIKKVMLDKIATLDEATLIKILQEYIYAESL